MNLVLVDILGENLAQRADELRADFGIDVLICNHMFTPSDTPKILDVPLDMRSRMLDINARGYTNLIYRFGTEMRERGRGAIIIVSSGIGLTSGPYNGVYAANKAFQIVWEKRFGTSSRARASTCWSSSVG